MAPARCRLSDHSEGNFNTPHDTCLIQAHLNEAIAFPRHVHGQLDAVPDLARLHARQVRVHYRCHLRISGCSEVFNSTCTQEASKFHSGRSGCGRGNEHQGGRARQRDQLGLRLIINCMTDHRLDTRLCTVQARTFAPSSATASCPDFAVDAGIWPSNLPQTTDDAHHHVL